MVDFVVLPDIGPGGWRGILLSLKHHCVQLLRRNLRFHRSNAVCEVCFESIITIGGSYFLWEFFSFQHFVSFKNRDEGGFALHREGCVYFHDRLGPLLTLMC